MPTRFAVLRPVVVVAAVLLGALSAGCPGPEYPKCEKDENCKKDKDGKSINEYCLFGQCQQCAKDSHCAQGERCSRGRCEKACTSDDQCGAGNICDAASCAPAQCSDQKPCAGGLACNKGRCQSPSSTSNNTGNGGNGGALACEKAVRVNFDFNVSDLQPGGRAVLDNFAKCMQQNADWALTIEGHCDERGTTDYNLALGERRASAIRDYLVRLGIDKGRVKTISYGKERPIAQGAGEDAWAQNRRGELIVK